MNLESKQKKTKQRRLTDLQSTRTKIFTRLSKEVISNLQQHFRNSNDKRLNENTLIDLISELSRTDLNKEVFHSYFMRMDTKGCGAITWDEYISYLMIDYDHSTIIPEYSSLLDPIPTPPRILKSHHRHPINKIAIFPTVKQDRSISITEGTIVTCSKDGLVHFWSPYLKLQRTGQSTCPELKVQSTWILDMVILPDVNVICTSSTERDLRFYDTSANKFELRIMITVLKSAVTAMSYQFDEDVGESSKLVLGTISGEIIIMHIMTMARGPFRSKTGDPLLSIRYDRVLAGKVPEIRIVKTNTDHKNFVQQIAIYNSLHSVLSCSLNPSAALILTDFSDLKPSTTIFKKTNGVCCFAIEESIHIIASGGTDCLVRLWNSFVPNQPTGILYGHHTTVVHLTFQDNAKLLYSLSKDRRIKVWDVARQTCLQTYLDLQNEINCRAGLSALYLNETRQWIIGSNVVAVVGLSPQPNPQHTDGDTHINAVSVILYNKLFKILVTCGLDSYIIAWNPWDGRRMLVIRNAHTKTVYAEEIPVEITAAAFGPVQMRLITGAHDGTMKIWDINTGSCMRNLCIDVGCEVTSILWTMNRIFAAGWNKCLTEFSDYGISEGKSLEGRNWDTLHDEELTTAAVRTPQTIVTASYSGELVFWRLETGQAYSKFNVMEPKNRIKILYKTKELPKSLNIPIIKKSQNDFRNISIICMQFLNSRTMDPDIGTLLVSLSNGIIQVWSHHSAGGFITSFCAVHNNSDYISSITTDESNEFLFTGSVLGYIKIWLLENYCTTEENMKTVSMPSYRLRFPFMWGDRFVGRAQRAVRQQPLPVLLNSFRGHLKPVTHLVYLSQAEILISSSTDKSVRMWTLSGIYIQTIGTFKEWLPLINKPLNIKTMPKKIPSDLKRKISSTTLRVLMGGFIKKIPINDTKVISQDRTAVIDKSKIYGNSLSVPVLGDFYHIPKRTTRTGTIEFDTSFPYIPVYQHINLTELDEIEEPKEVPLLTDISDNNKLQ